jgi:Pycsar effector protein
MDLFPSVLNVMSGRAWLMPRRARAAAAPPHRRDIEFGWRVHTAQESWASKADVKASIVLAFEGGALYAVISALGPGGMLAGHGGPRHIAEVTGAGLLLLSLISAACAVFPRLGRVRTREEDKPGSIYFGDLRHWDVAELRDHLAAQNQDSELEALSRQLVWMARYNWSKYRWTQTSVILALAGILTVAGAAATAL